jgi:hypothetical protein
MPGKNFSSYFRTGPKLRGEGHRNQIEEYITVHCKSVVDGSAFVRGKWDWTNSINSKKWSSEQQVYTANRSNRSLSRKRLLFRGMGPSVQLEFRSEEGKPFNIVGWAAWESVDAVP